MTTPLVFAATFRVPGRDVEELAALADAMTATAPTSAWVYVDDDARTIGYVQVHADAEAMDAHLQRTHGQIAAAFDLVEPANILVCGEPGPLLTLALDANRRAGATVTVLTRPLRGTTLPDAA